MKKALVLLLVNVAGIIIISAQERFLSLQSKDSINGSPRYKTSLGANLKLNGYFDIFGGLQDSETFNIGNINVFGTDDSKSLKVDMYQTQIKWETSVVLKDGKKISAVIETDFWGGDGHIRLRKAYVETEHWQIGQNWNNFGDEVLWPDIMEWEGPPSGIWLRTPHVKYKNTLRNENFIYEISLEAPMTDYERFPDIEPYVEEATQFTPDLTFAMKYEKPWGHIRLSSVYRHIRYKLDGNEDSFFGYGFSLSGIYSAVESKNNFQYQFVSGKGITAYMTTIAGQGYDGYPTVNDDFNATPALGGWSSYEYYFAPKWHSSFVLGYTQYYTDNMERYIVTDEIDSGELFLDGDVKNYHYYGIVNLMFDPYERMTVGLELDYGVKTLDAQGHLNNVFVDNSKTRDAMRISFGFMFYF
ncbi:hypothetical protein JM658_03865 [Joostella atrarenae]|uniref:Porin n=1 Tax=Joostella atrarenae TaxID=679257 RepID=A0ABS9J0T9_9FLAO|nr:hypothetical protein [Joostella atrarenae]MCF8713955.1 hypothetical protein [Joostella atrarenae]